MQGQIVGDIVVKPGLVPAFYHDCPVEFCPRLFATSATQYAYNYVEGRQARTEDVPRILKLCQEVLWRGVPGLFLFDIDKSHYINYIESLVNQVTAQSVEMIEVVTEAVAIIRGSVLPQAMLVHGDLTFENIIVQSNGNIIFIDPGNPRRCVTPALDRGKLLQSVVMRWESREEWTYKPEPWLEPDRWPAWANEVDWAFLVTHWVRLIRHWPNLDILSGFNTLAKLRPK